MIFNRIVDLFVKLKDAAGNALTSSDIGNSQRALDTVTVLRDSSHPEYKAKVDGAGNLFTVTPQPQTPAGKIKLAHVLLSAVTGTDNSYMIIPVGEIVTIQRFKGGAESSSGGSRIILYYAPNGDLTDLELIEILYENGSSDSVDLGYITPVGDGTNAILLQRSYLSGGANEVFGKWEGYY